VNDLQLFIDEAYELAKAGHWKRLLSLWTDSPVLANRCSRYVNAGSKWTFLHQAAYFGHQDACRSLIARGASVDALTRNERTPADVAAEKGQQEVEQLLRRASLGRDSSWQPSPDPDVLPGSNCWEEGVEAVASVELFVAYGGSIVRIHKRSTYYMDSFQRILIGFHGSFDPPSDMGGYSLIPGYY
jgi:hypothetical protein